MNKQPTDEEVKELVERLQCELMERHPAMLDDIQLRWAYQKRILSTPIRLLKRFVRWLRS